MQGGGPSRKSLWVFFGKLKFQGQKKQETVQVTTAPSRFIFSRKKWNGEFMGNIPVVNLTDT